MRKTHIAAGITAIVIAITSLTTFSQTPSKNVVAHPVIKDRPEPSWPTSIKKKVDCTIVLRAVFRSNGKVTNISPYEVRPEQPVGLSSADIDELTKRAIEAAERIKFIPATKDGRPVSWWMQLEYHFRLDDDSSPAKNKTK